MRTRHRRILTAALLLGAGLALLSPTLGGQSAPNGAPPAIYSAEVNSIIHPVSAEFMIETIAEADREGAALVIFRLQTPGGLVDSTRDIVSSMLAATTPIVVFVGPSGARAASAGFILALAADVTAMAPGTHIGAAHPVSAGGQQQPDEVMAQKAASDVAAYVRTLAEGRQRNVGLSEEAVNDSRAFTESEALGASPPLIDLIATDLSDLIRQLDGRTVRRFDGTTVVLATANAPILPREMNLRQRVLSAIANPSIAYMLLSLGMLGLTIELWNPGAVLPGVVGGLSLLLAFFALQLLPVNYTGLLLILLGLVMLGLEIKVPSFGLLTVGGAVSLIFGSLMLIDSPVPELQLSLRFVLPVVIGFVGIGALLVRLGISALRQQSVTGQEGMIGLLGLTLSPIEPGSGGRVQTHGEIWQAIATEAIPEGARVRVVGVDGLTVTVNKD